MENQTDQNRKYKKFDGRAYTFWKSKVTNGLRYLGLEKYLETKAEIDKTPDEKTLEQRALSFVMDALCDNLFRKYVGHNTLKDFWDALKQDYESTDAQKQFVLRKKFLNCTKNRKERIADYIDKLTSYSLDLANAENTVTDQEFILTLLDGTHEEFGSFISAVCAKKAAKDLNKQEVISLLIKEDDLRRLVKEDNDQRPMNHNPNSFQDRRVMFTRNNHKSHSSKFAKKSNFSKKNHKCYNCGIPGHYANECKRMKS